MNRDNLFELLQCCTVRIEASNQYKNEKKATGFFIAPNLILTCAHAIEGCSNIKVCWQKKWYIAEIDRMNSDSDLALLRGVNAFPEHPCVFLGESINNHDELYLHGYETVKRGVNYKTSDTPKTLKCIGFADERRIIKVKGTYFNPSLSGSPLLNLRTGKVCGIIRSNRSIPKLELDEGLAIPTKVVFSEWSDLIELQRDFHQRCLQWKLSLFSFQAPLVESSFDVLDQRFFAEQGKKGHSQILKLRVATWALILQGNYINRDQQDELLSIAEKLAEFEGFSLLLIRGEPGAGKTALFRWLAYQLVCKGHFVLQKRNLDDDLEWLEKLQNFSEKVDGKHFYVIADDLFRDEAILNKLEQHQDQVFFPFTLIGTTRFNEDRNENLGGLGYEIKIFDLKAPSNLEKDRVLKNIFQNLSVKARFDDLEKDEKEKLMTAPTMLVLMLQLSEAKHFDQIIADVIKNLPSPSKRYGEELGYEVFGVISSFFQFGIVTPPDILFMCLIQYPCSAVMKVISPAESKSLIGLISNVSKGGYEGLTTVHELIAQKAVELKYIPRSHAKREENPPYAPNLIEYCLKTAIQGLDSTKEFHVRWAYLAMRRLVANRKNDLVLQLLNDQPEKIKALQKQNSIIASFSWAKIYESVNLPDERDKCLNAILLTKPQTQWEWAYCLSQIANKGSNQQKQEAIYQAEIWLKNHPNDYHVCSKYLFLIQQKGTPEQKQNAIYHIVGWLQNHAGDPEIFTQYLTLVEEGTLKQKYDAIIKTSTWLDTHYNNPNVRTKYLRLIREHGTSEQKQSAIVQTSVWLALPKHRDSSDVLTQYLTLVGQHGTLKQKLDAIGETDIWLQEHPDKSDVRSNFLSFVRKNGAELVDIQSIIVHQWEWINRQKKVDQLSWTAFLPILEYCDKPDLIKKAVESALAQHPKNVRIIGIALKYLQMYLPIETSLLLAYQIDKLIGINELPVTMLRPYLIEAANFLRDHDNLDTAEQIYCKVINWARGKQKKDAYETLKVASENYEHLLWIKEVKQDLPK